MRGGGIGGRLVPDRIRESYLLKFGLALGVVLAATGIVGAYAFVQTDRNLDRQVEAELRTTASDEAATVENWLDERARLARMLSEFEPMSRNASRPMSLFLQQEKRNLPSDVFRVHVVDNATGTVIGTNAPLVVDEDLPSRAPWGNASLGFSQEDDAVYRSEVYLSDGVPVVAFVSPVPNYPQRLLVLTADVGSVAQDFGKPIDGSFTRVVDGNGTVVVDGQAGEPRTLDPYRPNGTSPVVRAGSDGTSFFQDAPVERSLASDYVIASSPVEGTDWTVVAHVPARGAYELRRAVVLQLLAVLLVAVIGVGFIGLTIGRNTVAALNRLSTTARALERGNLAVDLESDRDDEIGDLFAAFASMRDSLRDRIDRLSAAKESAEDARAELAETNRDLEEQRVIISVLNRLLTHNLRNSMAIVMGHAEELAGKLSGSDAEDAETIRRTAEVTVRRIEKSKQVEQVVQSGERRPRALDVPGVLDGIVEQFRRQYPDASIHTDLPEACTVLADESLGFVLDNLVENAIEHNDRAEPSVWIRVGERSDGDEVEIRIEDDGPGIPDMEIEVLERDRETKLDHGSGMGLWLVNWLVEYLGGSLAFDDRDPRGTVAVVHLEQATDRDPSRDLGDGERAETDPVSGSDPED